MQDRDKDLTELSEAELAHVTGGHKKGTGGSGGGGGGGGGGRCGRCGGGRGRN